MDMASPQRPIGKRKEVVAPARRKQGIAPFCLISSCEAFAKPYPCKGKRSHITLNMAAK